MIKNLNNYQITVPDTKEILELERAMSGERLEIAQEIFDVLHDIKQAKNDPVLAWKVNNSNHILKGLQRVNREAKTSDKRPAGMLFAKVYNEHGVLGDLGLASVNVVTTAGVNYVVDSLQGTATINNLRWHASGTTNTAEAIGDTTLAAETGSRVSGTQAEGASANIFQTVATVSYGSSLTIVEHGLFSASSGGTLFDRSVFTGIGVDTVTSIEFTYEWTLNSGG